MINGTVPANHRYTYITGCVIILVVFGVVFFVQYNSSFFSTYRESEHRRINIAEKLRTLPLSFFGKKDLADLTSTILGDCTVLEHNFSHVMPQFFGAMISTVLIAISLFFFDWRMALAALWVLPIALIIVGCSGNVQRGISRRKRIVDIAQADGLQEYLETIKDLKSYNAEESYLEGLKGRITALEKESFKAELGTAVFVVSASCILRFGIGTVALVGSVLLCSGKLDVLTFLMFILVVSRIYEPMQGTLMNLAAVIAQDVNVERMNEITDYPVQKGSDEIDVKSYDIEFSNVSFSYDKHEKVLNDISFTAKQGEVTALIGPSGGGKSTVSKLAARFWDVDGGSIRLGGKDISQVDPEKLLSAYSIVFQDVILFDNTIMENISEDAVLSWSCGEYNDAMIRYIEEKKESYLPYPDRTLEVLARGTDFVNTHLKNHPVHATKEMMADKIDELMSTWDGLEYIYIATEDLSYVEYFRNRFGDKVYFTDQQRYSTRPGQLLYDYHRSEPDRQTGFNLGAEYAASIALLAQCNSFLASGWCTGVSEAIRENQGNYRNKYIFDLGFNN